MNKKQKTKLIGIFCIAILLGLAMGLILYALKQNINLFYTPSEFLAAKIKPDQMVRLGGYVKKHSVRFNQDGQQVNFIVTDRTHEIRVHFNGVLPSLFREGQVVVVTGKWDGTNALVASQVLAKHDEKYMPKPLAEKLKGKLHDS